MKDNSINELLNKFSISEVRVVLDIVYKAKLDSDYYDLLVSDYRRALPIGRYFVHVNNVNKKFKEIIFDVSIEFKHRVQAIYELLECNQGITIQDIINYRKIILDNLNTFNIICKEVYGIEDIYFDKLSDKIKYSSRSKKWLYVYEMALLFKNNNNAQRIIKENCALDQFVNEAFNEFEYVYNREIR